jgi:hypothetical protein
MMAFYWCYTNCRGNVLLIRLFYHAASFTEWWMWRNVRADSTILLWHYRHWGQWRTLWPAGLSDPTQDCARLTRQLVQTELQKICGASWPTVSRWETGYQQGTNRVPTERNSWCYSRILRKENTTVQGDVIPLFCDTLTNGMEENPLWEAADFSASHKFTCTLWNLKVHYRVHKTYPFE